MMAVEQGRSPAQPHRARKRFGQNFLRDRGMIGRIIRAIDPGADDAIVEIGPGQGALTGSLQAGAGSLDLVELDRDLVPRLQQQFGTHDNVRIHQADALTFDFAALQPPDKPLRIVGNLPYNVSVPLLFHLVGCGALIRDMHFMLQKEVVDRLVAGVGDRHYGRLGIMMQYHCQVTPLFGVPPSVFHPVPRVDSGFVRLMPHQELPCPCQDLAALDRVVKAAFSARRKTLRNGLKGLLDSGEIEQLEIDPGLRPEQISLPAFVRLADHLAQRGKT